jgi:hypothetical protein
LETILALAIALLAAVFISLPFFLKSRKADGGEYFPDPRAEKAKELDSRKESLLSAIKDIEFDHGLGKLTREDFEELHGKYRAEAAAILKEMDSIGAARTVEDYDGIESEIRAERNKFLAPYDDEEIEKEILRAREASWSAAAEKSCARCGSGAGAEDLYCSKCGARLDLTTETRNAKPL